MLSECNNPTMIYLTQKTPKASQPGPNARRPAHPHPVVLNEAALEKQMPERRQWTENSGTRTEATLRHKETMPNPSFGRLSASFSCQRLFEGHTWGCS